jgi:uncharacterized protein
VKQDGLVHVSEISHTYITDPNEALKLNQKVTVKVVEVDTGRKRIALSIKQTEEGPARKERSAPAKQQQRTGGRQSGQQKAKEQDMSGMNMNDALSLLKQRFGK